MPATHRAGDEVFLVSRVLEERRRGLTERAAVIEGLASTAGLITSAAAIMIAVFAAFMLGNFLIIKMLGFTLAVAVLIDATLCGWSLARLCSKLRATGTGGLWVSRTLGRLPQRRQPDDIAHDG